MTSVAFRTGILSLDFAEAALNTLSISLYVTSRRMRTIYDKRNKYIQVYCMILVAILRSITPLCKAYRPLRLVRPRLPAGMCEPTPAFNHFGATHGR